MGSNYFGEQKMGSERGGGGSSSSTRRGKKSSNNSDKPKQPQRGLGVAQLEKIRLHGHQLPCPNYHPDLHASYPTSTTNFIHDDMRVQAAFSSMPSSSFSYSPSYDYPVPYGLHHNIMPGLSHDQYETTNLRYSDSQQASWIPNFGVYEAQRFVQADINRHIMDLHNEGTALHKSFKKPRSGSMGSSTSRTSDSSDTQEVDLELRLSL